MIRIIIKSVTVCGETRFVDTKYKTVDIHNAWLQDYLTNDLHGASEIIGAEIYFNDNLAGCKNATEPAVTEYKNVAMEFQNPNKQPENIPATAPTKQETIMQLTRKDAETIRLGGVIHEKY